MNVFKKFLSLCLAVLTASVVFCCTPSNANAAVKDIMILFDAEGIVEATGAGGTLDSPNPVINPNDYIFLCTSSSNVTANTPNCSAELSIDACNKDDMYFRWKPLNQSGPYTVVINEFNITNQPIPDAITDKGFISTPVNYPTYKNVPPNTKSIDNSSLTFSVVNVPAWQMTVNELQAGQVAYQGIFSILYNGDYQETYTWDPLINIQAATGSGCPHVK